MAGNVEETETTVVVQCPHCKTEPGREEHELWMAIDRREFNCRIFRHGYMRIPWERGGQAVPMPPHAPKPQCDAWAAGGERSRIIGCGRPFRLVDVVNDKGEKTTQAVVCDYI